MRVARDVIIEWIEQGHVRSQDLPQAFVLAGVTPDGNAWRHFIAGLLLWLGAVLLAAGTIFFFAYNWQALGRFAKFGLLEGLFVAAAAAAWYYGLEKIAGQAFLLLAALLTGALLALIGQTYQTGADPYELFAVWALLILPWVAVVRVAALWLMWVALLNLAIVLYFQAFRGLFGVVFADGNLLWILFALNTAALAAWEFAAFRGVNWMRGRWPARAFATASGALAATLALWAIFDGRSSIGPFALSAYALWMAAVYFYYRHRKRDLFMLAGGVLSAIVVVAAFLGDSMLERADAGGFLFIGLVVIGMSAAGALWLKKIGAEEDQ
jgi:uncharacterized membrane protein